MATIYTHSSIAGDSAATETNPRRTKNCTMTTGIRGTILDAGIAARSAIASTKQKPSSHGGCLAKGWDLQPQDSQSRFPGSCLSFERYASCEAHTKKVRKRTSNNLGVGAQALDESKPRLVARGRIDISDFARPRKRNAWSESAVVRGLPCQMTNSGVCQNLTFIAILPS